MLKEFYKHLKEEQAEVAELWTYKAYQTPHGEREELAFQDHAAILQYLPDCTWSLTILQTSRDVVYRHAHFVVHRLFAWVLETEEDNKLQLSLHGKAWQAVMRFQADPEIEMSEQYSEGTLEHKDRHGNFKDKVLKRVVSVLLRRAQNG